MHGVSMWDGSVVSFMLLLLVQSKKRGGVLASSGSIGLTWASCKILFFFIAIGSTVNDGD